MPDPGQLDLLLVDPDYQGLGFGLAILKDILGHNDVEGRETCLEVFNQNSRAIKLYASLGFCDETVSRKPGIYPRDLFTFMVRQPR